MEAGSRTGSKGGAAERHRKAPTKRSKTIGEKDAVHKTTPKSDKM